jgi:AcrR family transcriptional regulator
MIYYCQAMGRPRTVSDEQILMATIRAMTRLGPVKLTLADVAAEAGLSPAALVKRFGSKRGLLLAVSNAAGSGMSESFARLRRTASSPLAALLEATTYLARHTRSAEELANHLAFLQVDVTDPEFRKPMLVMSRATLAGYEALLADAVAARELRPCDTRALARAINAVVGGSLIAWAVFRKGTAVRWVRADVETVLAPYRRRRG